jgi:hypothetical protein
MVFAIVAFYHLAFFNRRLFYQEHYYAQYFSLMFTIRFSQRRRAESHGRQSWLLQGRDQ